MVDLTLPVALTNNERKNAEKVIFLNNSMYIKNPDITTDTFNVIHPGFNKKTTHGILAIASILKNTAGYAQLLQ